MKTVQNIRPDKASNEKEFYKWDVISDDGKTGTFYTDPTGENIWQENTSSVNIQIYNSSLIDQGKLFQIKVDASIEKLHAQLQAFADKGLFNKYLK
jgi:phosphoribosylformylglycinamidine (FGAM) synthase PurS component